MSGSSRRRRPERSGPGSSAVGAPGRATRRAQLTRIADLGGGRGHLLHRLLEQWPHLHGVLVDWDDAGATAILRRAAAACGSGGRVIVIERELADDASTAARLEATAQDLRLFVLFGGGERTPDDLQSLAASAGLALESRRRLTSGRSMLELTAHPHSGAGSGDC